MTRRYAPRIVLASHFDTQVQEERREAARPRIPAPVSPPAPAALAPEPVKPAPQAKKIVVEKRIIGQQPTGELDEDTLNRAIDQLFGSDERKPQ